MTFLWLHCDNSSVFAEKEPVLIDLPTTRNDRRAPGEMENLSDSTDTFIDGGVALVVGQCRRGCARPHLAIKSREVATSKK